MFTGCMSKNIFCIPFLIFTDLSVISINNAEKFIKTVIVTVIYKNINRVPNPDFEPGNVGEHFPVREKSGNFSQTIHHSLFDTQGTTHCPSSLAG